MENLYKVKINLPGYSDVFIDIHYYDSSPNNEINQPIILASHGTPGSHKDFKYMVPTLLASGYRVISLNWPGFGITKNPPEELFSHTNSERAQLLSSFVKALNLQKIDVAIGHSGGCYPYPLFFCDNPGICDAAVFIAPGGATPSRPWRPYWYIRLVAFLLNTWLKPLMTRFAYFLITKVFCVRLDHTDQAAIITRIAANMNFEYLNAVILSLKESKNNPPIVLVCTKEDHLVEKERSIEYAEKLGCHEHDGIYHIEKGDNINEVIEKMLSFSGRLDRHCAILLERGGHHLQKHEAYSICKLINAIFNANRN